MAIPAVGARVLAESDRGYWRLGTTSGSEGARTRLRNDRKPEPAWLEPERFMIAAGKEAAARWLLPERLALVPPAEPTELPPPGSPVIALHGGTRWHPGVLVRRLADGRGEVLFDLGDWAAFRPAELLRRGATASAAIERHGATGHVLRARVRAPSGRTGWIARLGTAALFVHWDEQRHGEWVAPDDLALTGERQPERPRLEKAPALGSRVVYVTWPDRGRRSAVVTATDSLHGEPGVVVAHGQRSLFVTLRQVVSVRDTPRPIGDERPALDRLGVSTCAKLRGSHEQRGKTVVVEAVRGGQRFVRTLAGDALWVRESDLAWHLGDLAPPAAPPPGSLVCKGFRSGRTAEVVGVDGDAIVVKTSEGNGERWPLDDVWVIHWGERASPSEPVPKWLKKGARVQVEMLPGEHADAVVEDPFLHKVRLTEGPVAYVDLARLRPQEQVAAGPAPPSAAAPTPTPAPRPEPPSADELFVDWLRSVHAQWMGSGGYRDAPRMHLVDGRLLLPTARGTLTATLLRQGELALLFEAEVTDEPPPPSLVRLARRLRDLFSSADEQADAARREADATWVRELCAPHAASLVRAGPTVTLLTVERGGSLAPALVSRWARDLVSRETERQ